MGLGIVSPHAHLLSNRSQHVQNAQYYLFFHHQALPSLSHILGKATK